jgi:hypothetical protein
MKKDTICYTFWRGVKNYKELMAYLNKNGDLPNCEMFQTLKQGDAKLIKGKGYIEKEYCDTQLHKEIPQTLKEALGIDTDQVFISKKKKLKRDVVVSVVNGKNLVGVYWADTDGREILFETSPEKADKIIKIFNEK